jgi:hypothetical protein
MYHKNPLSSIASLMLLSTPLVCESTLTHAYAGVALQINQSTITQRQNAHSGAEAPAKYLPKQYRPALSHALRSTAKPNAIIAICQPLLEPGPSPIPSQKGGNILKLKCIPHTLHYAGVVINKTTATALESGGKGAILVVPVKKGY